MTIPQRLSFAQFLNATYNVVLHSRRVRRFLVFMLIILFLSSFLGLVTVPGYSMSLTDILLTVLSLFMLVAGFLAVIFIICLIIYKTQPHLFHPVAYEFTHWGVIRHGEKTAFSKPWRELSKYRETKSFFILYVLPNDCHVIQKSMFQSEEQVQGFAEMLQANISRK